MNVTALDIVAPVVVRVETQPTWDATENWAKVTAQDDNSGVVAIEMCIRDRVSMVWTYVAEMIFNMMVLVGLVKGSDRIVREMMSL